MIRHILQIFVKFPYSYTKTFIKIIEKLLNSSYETLEILSKDIKYIAEVLQEEEKHSWLVTILLNLIHDEDRDINMYGVQMLADVIQYLDAEVSNNFILPVVLSLTKNDTTSKILSLDLIPSLTNHLNSLQSL